MDLTRVDPSSMSLLQVRRVDPGEWEGLARPSVSYVRCPSYQIGATKVTYALRLVQEHKGPNLAIWGRQNNRGRQPSLCDGVLCFGGGVLRAITQRLFR